MSLYETIGVGKTATAEEIRLAYRAKVKTAHPDMGGDPEEFHKLQEAYDTLSDPDARAHYDATGQTNTGSKLNGDLQAIELLSQIIEAMIHDPRLNLVTEDIVNIMAMNVKTLIGNMEETIEALEKQKERIQEFKTRLVLQDGGESNPLAATLDYSLGQCGKKMEAAQMQMSLRKRALEILERYGYDFVRALPAATIILTGTSGGAGPTIFAQQQAKKQGWFPDIGIFKV